MRAAGRDGHRSFVTHAECSPPRAAELKVLDERKLPDDRSVYVRRAPLPEIDYRYTRPDGIFQCLEWLGGVIDGRIIPLAMGLTPSGSPSRFVFTTRARPVQEPKVIRMKFSLRSLNPLWSVLPAWHEQVEKTLLLRDARVRLASGKPCLSRPVRRIC